MPEKSEVDLWAVKAEAMKEYISDKIYYFTTPGDSYQADMEKGHAYAVFEYLRDEIAYRGEYPVPCIAREVVHTEPGKDEFYVFRTYWDRSQFDFKKRSHTLYSCDILAKDAWYSGVIEIARIVETEQGGVMPQIYLTAQRYEAYLAELKEKMEDTPEEGEWPV